MPQRPKIVLGVSFGHGDSSAALILDGKLIAAAEEERFNRIKHFAGFPEEATKYCLQEAGITSSDVEVVAVAKKARNQSLKKLNLLLSHPHLIQQAFSRNKQEEPTFSEWLYQMGLSHVRTHHCEHHHAHMLSSRYLSSSEEQAFLSFDGLGDFVSAAIGKSTAQGVKILDRVVYPHSLGFFYTAMTQYLGFPYFGDEFKVMGLSSLGEPKYLSQMRNLVREAEPFGFRLNLEAFPILTVGKVFKVENSKPQVESFFNTPYLTAILGVPPRKKGQPIQKEHQDLACSVQARFEEVANHLLRHLENLVPCETLALSGGCAHNSVWVGKIPTHTKFREIKLAPASHDAGIAVGAAISASGGPVTPQSDTHGWAFLGPKPRGLVRMPEELEEHVFSKEAKLIDFLAEELSQGKIVGVIRDRLEFGPRALGNRSILADPRQSEMKDRLNARVKHRESFRPFAASVLKEHQDQWFENPFYSPYMEAVFKVIPKNQDQIAGVVHTDGSCRIQSVTQKEQPFYWDLIDSFRKKTGVPMLINTSFNDSEPIVLSAEDAIKCFLSTEMDYLLIENRLFSKKRASLALTA